MIIQVTAQQVLVMPTFNRHSMLVYPKSTIQVTAPKSDVDYKVRQRPDDEKYGGLVKEIHSGDELIIGTPQGRFIVNAAEQRKAVTIQSNVDCRFLLRSEMIPKEKIGESDVHFQFNALCVAYLSGRTLDDIEQRPDAIFSRTSDKNRDAAINAMREHGFYKCLKVMRGLIK